VVEAEPRASGPARSFAGLAGRWGVRLALLSAGWLWAFPGWALAAARGSEGAALGGAWLVALALYARCVARHDSGAPRTRVRWLAVFTVWLALATAMSRAALGVFAIVVLDFAVRSGGAARRAERRGDVLLPDAMVYAIAALPLGLVLLNPGLYGAPAPALVSALLRPVEQSGFHLLDFGAPVAAAAGAWLSSSVCRRHLPARSAALAKGAALVVVAAAALAAAAFE
jgi:hypothetical protein